MGCQQSVALAEQNTIPLSEKVKQHAIKTMKDGGLSRRMFIADHTIEIPEVYSLGNKKLGDGNFGFVVTGTQKKSNAKRAVKVIRKKDVERNNLFHREIAILKALDHPHIVKLYESFEDRKNYYIAMELCSGGELFDRVVDTESGFSELQAAIFSQQMLQTVMYLHAHRICHRDLKPENWLFYNFNPQRVQDSLLKLIDFGLSCPFREDGQPFKSVVGSPYYLAPEVLAQSYGPECDIWSMGCIIYVLLCGYPPFQGDNDIITISKVKAGKLVFPKDEFEKTSDAAKGLIRKLLCVNVKERMSLQQALTVDWVKRKGVVASSILRTSDVQRLCHFEKEHRLKKAALHVIAAHLKEEEIAPLRKIFKSLDTNEDGMLCKDELQAGLKKSGIHDLSPSDVQHVTNTVDVDGSGFIDYTEFLAAVLDPKLATQESVCYEAFIVFDRNGDGKIDRDELGAVITENHLEKSVDPQAIDAMLKEVDTNNDGVIDFNEFLAMMQGFNVDLQI